MDIAEFSDAAMDKVTEFLGPLMDPDNRYKPLGTARELANEYLLDGSYPDNDARADALIRWETAKNATLGFATGLGGMVTLPVAIPTALAGSLIVQCRMVNALGVLYGADVTGERFKFLLLASVLGDTAASAVKEVAKVAGVAITKKMLLEQIPGAALSAINKQIGIRLVTKCGQRGVVNLVKFAPLVGGLIGGAFDSVTCYIVGQNAKRMIKSMMAGSLTLPGADD